MSPTIVHVPRTRTASACEMPSLPYYTYAAAPRPLQQCTGRNADQRTRVLKGYASRDLQFGVECNFYMVQLTGVLESRPGREAASLGYTT
jgi:hypothetical protein